MTIKHRINKLEAALGGRSTKHYLWVRVMYGERKQDAIERYLRERGITLDDVGYLWLWGADCCETVDYKSYAHNEDLIGYFDVMKELRTWLDSINGQSLGSPSEQPGFQDETRRYEEIETRRVNV
ncbi:MAG TPA: hypothetical protein VKB96_07310 [Gammaproteobacteria bacterium]|nr:hypothetical protein [Gammaproteobacteria bacterium]